MRLKTVTGTSALSVDIADGDVLYEAIDRP